MNQCMNRDQIIDVDQLYDSMYKCRRGVSWKPSVKEFTLDGLKNCLEMEKELKSGRFKNSKPRPIIIGYPKRREGLSISYKDRVYQRDLNDNALYPIMSNSLVYSNCACQKGKGPDFARRLVNKYLHRHFINHGLEGYVAQIDIHGYYDHIDHKRAEQFFKEHLPEDIYKMTVGVLHDQYDRKSGYSPGSQMIQILGISFLSPIDHYLKDVLQEKSDVRYMDDFWGLFLTKQEAQKHNDTVISMLDDIGLSVNEKKTKIVPLSEGFTFLGFNYRLTETGKIVMTVKSQNVKREKKKLYHLSRKVFRGEKRKDEVDVSFFDWEQHTMIGNSYKLCKRMETYYQNLWRNKNGFNYTQLPVS